MSQIEKLIQQHCPDGVRSFKLSELGVLYGGLTGKSKEDFKEGNSRFVSYMNVYSNLATNVEPSDYVTIENGERQLQLNYGDVLFTGSSETPDECGMSSVLTVEPPEPLYLNSFCIAFRLNDVELYDPDFLKHLFRSSRMREQISRTANGVTRFNVSKSRLIKIAIPCPPLEVQAKIAHTLDLFLKLGAELEAELEARVKQYDAFCKIRFEFAGNMEVEWGAIGQFCSTFSGSFVKKTEQDDSYEYPVFNGGASATGFYNDFNAPGKSIAISARGSIGSVNWVKTKFWAGNSCHVVQATNPRLNNRFLYHYLKFHEPALYELRAVGTIPALNLKPLLTFKIPVPSLELQTQISAELDQFESITVGTDASLTAELNARRKQYEYYRDKLLTFEEAA